MRKIRNGDLRKDFSDFQLARHFPYASFRREHKPEAHGRIERRARTNKMVKGQFALNHLSRGS